MTNSFTANRADGSTIDFSDPHYGPFNPAEVFEAWSWINRWAGNLTREYCLLQHALLVAETIVQPELKIYGLLHDGPEEGTGDVSGPFKAYLNHLTNGAVTKHEHHLFACYCKAAGIAPPNEQTMDIVHDADMIVRATEARDVVKNSTNIHIPYKPLQQTIPVVPRGELIAQALDVFPIYLDMHLDAMLDFSHG